MADLESFDGIELARRLARVSDVVMEDLTPGRMAELGLDLAALRAERPELVTCSITSFGQTGPYAGLP